MIKCLPGKIKWKVSRRDDITQILLPKGGSLVSRAVYRLSSGGGVLMELGRVLTLTSLNLGLALENGRLKADSLKSSLLTVDLKSCL